jgi:hypothetical protein
LIVIDYPVAICGIVILFVFARVAKKEAKDKLSKHTFKILICAVLQSAFKASSNAVLMNQQIQRFRDESYRAKDDAHTVVDFFGIMFK